MTEIFRYPKESGLKKKKLRPSIEAERKVNFQHTCVGQLRFVCTAVILRGLGSRLCARSWAQAILSILLDTSVMFALLFAHFMDEKMASSRYYAAQPRSPS